MYWRQVKSAKKAMKNMPVSVKAIIVSREGKALVMRKYNGLVDLPGGKVEPGEDMYEALAREVEEETGLKVSKFDFVASWVKSSAELGDRLVIIFETQISKKAKNIKIKMSDEHVWCDFLEWDQADELAHMAPGYVNALQICFNRYAPVPA